MNASSRRLQGVGDNFDQKFTLSLLGSEKDALNQIDGALTDCPFRRRLNNTSDPLDWVS
jgi:hypothetical protein